MRETGRARAARARDGRAAAALSLAGACKKDAPPPAPPPPEVAVVQVRAAPGADRVRVHRRGAALSPGRGAGSGRRRDRVAPVHRGRHGQAGPGALPPRPGAARGGLPERAGPVQNAKRTLDRLQPLLKQNAVAQQDVDNARADMEAAEGDLAEAKKNVDDAVVRAEIDGRVGRTNLEVGARVTGPVRSAHHDRRARSDLRELPALRAAAARLEAGSRGARKLIQPGSPLSVQVTLPDGTTLPRTGKLDFVAPSLDAATGTQEFRALFQNPDRLLVPGQFVRVRLTGFTRDSALAVPQRAVQQALGRQFVYVVGKGDTVAARDVQPGPWSGNLWIIDKGLNAGERVVVDGTQKAAPGRPVHPVPWRRTRAAAPEETAKLGATK